MRVLITGGNGFIGSHVIDRVIAKGHHPVSFDRYGSPYRRDVEFWLGDIRDRQRLGEAISQTDGVINLAAILGTSETIELLRFTVQSNLVGAINVFDLCRDLNKRAVHITVGNFWMNNPYAITKNAGERIALMYNKEFGTKIAVVRGLNAYGERQKDKPVRKIVPNLVLPALKNTEILLYGDGEQTMDMIYVGDLAEILVRALLVDHECYDRVFEAGMGRDLAPTINQLASQVVESAASKSRITHVPMRGGEPERSVVVGDPRTLEQLGMGVANMVSLKDGIAKTIAWYREHVNEFE